MTDPTPAPNRRAGGVIVAVVLLLACGLGLAGRYWWATRPAALDYGQAQHAIELAEADHVLSEKHCGSPTTARFSRYAWLQLTERQRRGVLLALSRVCSDRGQVTPVTLHDESGAVLANFDGRY